MTCVSRVIMFNNDPDRSTGVDPHCIPTAACVQCCTCNYRVEVIRYVAAVYENHSSKLIRKVGFSQTPTYRLTCPLLQENPEDKFITAQLALLLGLLCEGN